MTITESTQIYINIGTLIVLVGFVWRMSSAVATFEKRLQEVETKLTDHEEIDIKNNLSERLARIETDIQWIRKSLDTK